MRYSNIFKQTAVHLLITALLVPIFVIGGRAETPKSLTEDQKILHVLNRLGFGPRPGDLEKVRAMGLQKYIDRQLDPSSIDDSTAENKVKGLDIFSMTTAQLFAKYPSPAALLRALGVEGQPQQQAPPPANAAAPQTDAPAAQPADVQASDNERKMRQDRLKEVYAKYDLEHAARLMPEIVANRVLQAAYSERQLQEVMVDFWANHFNVFSGKGPLRWYIPSYERDVIRKNALGNFRDLLVGTAMHPAMLFYLDNFQSVSPNDQKPKNNEPRRIMMRTMRDPAMRPMTPNGRVRRDLGINDPLLNRRAMQDLPKQNLPTAPKKQQNRRGINENYARELMELHTLGVDGGYTQQDIIEVAKCFTGWTIADPRGDRKLAALAIKGMDNEQLEKLRRRAGVPDDIDSGEFYFNSRAHEGGTKTVLGQKIDEGGMKDGLKVIDILVSSPATARFIARKLAVRFVSDNPSDALVQRVADAFHNSKGDIKTTLRAIFSDKEFFAPENYRAKIKTPFELAVSSIRAIGADTDGGPQMFAMLRKLGEVPYGYQAPTGYPDTAEEWVNTGALLERLNYAIALSGGQIRGTRVDLSHFEGKTPEATLTNVIDGVLNGEISAATRASLEKQLKEPISPANVTVSGQKPATRPLAPKGGPDVFRAVSLVLGSPEFQRQ